MMVARGREEEVTMKLERRTSADSSIPTSSMSDIAFLLIIFFMVTAVFAATKGLAMQLPPREQGGGDPDPGVLIQVEREGIRVDCAPMAISGILPYLEPRIRANPDKPVILYPAPDVEYRRVVEVYDLLVGTRSDESEARFEVRRIALPTRGDIAAYVEAFGVNPFESYCP
jgi:biopolymer transport protein ExbD